MSNQKYFAARAALIAAALGAFSIGLPSAAAEKPSQKAQANAAEFARGARLWAENCNRCHNMRDPKDYRDEQWRPVIAHMRVRAGLSGDQAHAILRFLQESN